MTKKSVRIIREALKHDAGIREDNYRRALMWGDGVAAREYKTYWDELKRAMVQFDELVEKTKAITVTVLIAECDRLRQQNADLCRLLEPKRCTL